MTKCEYCGSAYTSPLAAELCGEEDREADLHARQQIRGRNTNSHRPRD